MRTVSRLRGTVRSAVPHATAAILALTCGAARAQELPNEIPLETIEKSDTTPFVGVRYSSLRASNGDGLRSYALRFDVPLASGQELRLDLPVYRVRFEPGQAISGFPGFSLTYFKDFQGGQRFHFLTSIPSSNSALSANEWILEPNYSISATRGPFALSANFAYTLGLFPTGPGPNTSLLSVSPGVSYSYKRLGLDLDYDISYDFANSVLAGGTTASFGPDLSYNFGNGLQLNTGYAFPLSTIRDSRIFQRDFYFNLGFRRP